LLRLLKKIKPTHTFFISFKPMALGIISSLMLTKTKKYLIFSGLGYAFINRTFKARFAKGVIKILLSIYSLIGSKFIFQNLDDFQTINELVTIKEANKHIISGNGINPKAFKSREKKLIDKKLSFLFVGRLLLDKGVTELLGAIELINSNARFILVAPEDNQNRASLDPGIKKNYDSRKYIQFFDRVDQDDLKKLYSNSDVFILPSYREGLPRAALEAMCSKLPLILTDVPGCRECVVHGENGFLVEPQNIESLAEAINAFIHKPEMVKKMGDKSYQIVEEKFSTGKIFKEYVELL